MTEHSRRRGYNLDILPRRSALSCSEQPDAHPLPLHHLAGAAQLVELGFSRRRRERRRWAGAPHWRTRLRHGGHAAEQGSLFLWLGISPALPASFKTHIVSANALEGGTAGEERTDSTGELERNARARSNRLARTWLHSDSLSSAAAVIHLPHGAGRRGSTYTGGCSPPDAPAPSRAAEQPHAPVEDGASLPLRGLEEAALLSLQNACRCPPAPPRAFGDPALARCTRIGHWQLLRAENGGPVPTRAGSCPRNRPRRPP